MKKLTLLIFVPIVMAGIAFFIPAKADGNDYLAQMSGCTECNSCKKRVVLALANIEGVTTVRFLKNKKVDLHQVIVETDGENEITLSQASSALKDLHHFELKSWDRQAEE